MSKKLQENQRKNVQEEIKQQEQQKKQKINEN